MANATFRQVQQANAFTLLADDDIIPGVAAPYGVGDDGGYTGSVIKEAVRDVVAAFLAQGTDISIVHDDPNDTLTISFSGTLYTDADARAATGWDFSSGTEVVGNEPGADVDLRFESDTKTAALFVDGATGNVGMNTPVPAGNLEVKINGGATNPILLSNDNLLLTGETAAQSFAGIVASSSSAGHRMVFKGTRAGGTIDTPTAAAGGDQSFTLLGSLYDGAAVRSTCSIEMIADGAVSSGVAPQRMSFWTGPTTSRSERVRITSAGNVGIQNTSPSVPLQVGGPVRVQSYTVAGVPSATSSGAGSIIHVSNPSSGNPRLYSSNGTNWYDGSGTILS